MSEINLNLFFPQIYSKQLRKFGIFLENLCPKQLVPLEAFFKLLNSYLPDASNYSVLINYYVAQFGNDKNKEYLSKAHFDYLLDDEFKKKFYFYALYNLIQISQKNNSQIFYINLLLYFRGFRGFSQDLFCDFCIMVNRKTFNNQYASIQLT